MRRADAAVDCLGPAADPACAWDGSRGRKTAAFGGFERRLDSFAVDGVGAAMEPAVVAAASCGAGMDQQDEVVAVVVVGSGAAVAGCYSVADVPAGLAEELLASRVVLVCWLAGIPACAFVAVVVVVAAAAAAAETAAGGAAAAASIDLSDAASIDWKAAAAASIDWSAAAASIDCNAAEVQWGHLVLGQGLLVFGKAEMEAAGLQLLLLSSSFASSSIDSSTLRPCFRPTFHSSMAPLQRKQLVLGVLLRLRLQLLLRRQRLLRRQSMASFLGQTVWWKTA